MSNDKLKNRLFRDFLDKMRRQKAPTFEIPAQSAEAYMSSPMPRWSTEQIQSCALEIYDMGRLQYWDKNGKHHTDFCVYMHNKEEAVFQCQSHNEAP